MAPTVKARTCGAKEVVFVGGFVKDLAKAHLAYATQFGAGPTGQHAVFVDRIAGYLGAIGALWV